MSKTIGTHSGNFHCDESLACYMLQLLPAYKDAKIVRSRDPKVLDTCDIIVDVGATYEPEKNRFDHHQRGFAETFSSEYTTKLSSAGLIYKHFGKSIIAQLTQCSEADVELIYQKIYKSFIQALDAIDNGESQYPEEVKAAYSINTDLSARVGKLNPRWNEADTDVQERFHKAMTLAGTEFVAAVEYLAKGWLPARDLVLEAIAKRHSVHPSGEIVVLDKYTVWKKHLLNAEEEQSITPLIKYVLYEDSSKAWRIQAVPVSSESFQSRLALPAAWRGVRDDALSGVTGIPGCMFAHASGFIGGGKTFDAVMQMAVKSLEIGASEAQEAKKQKTEASL